METCSTSLQDLQQLLIQIQPVLNTLFPTIWSIILVRKLFYA